MRGRTIVGAALAVAIAGGSAMAATAANAVPDSADPVPAGLFAVAEREGSVPVIVELAERRDQGEVLAELDGAGTVRAKYERFPLLAITAGPEALRRLADSDAVVRVHPDRLDRPTLASTIPLINADDVHARGLTGSGTAVAVLDSGIDRDHPFLEGRIVEEACFSVVEDGRQTLCPNGESQQTGAGSADAMTPACVEGSTLLCSHGSHVAGIAAGSAAGANDAPANGVAPEADLIAIQVFGRYDDEETCGGVPPCVLARQSDQILGLEHVLDLGAEYDIPAVNMSLGGGEYASACDDDVRAPVVQSLLDAGITVVASAGNDGYGAAIGAPACISDVVAVGATDDEDNLADFTNRGTLLDLFAPGVSVDSSVPDDGYATYNGTSMAAPHVAGAFAVLRQARPDATPAENLELLRASGVDVTYSSGGASVATPRLDLGAALPE